MLKRYCFKFSVKLNSYVEVWYTFTMESSKIDQSYVG
jgi:hypothetical protein